MKTKYLFCVYEKVFTVRTQWYRNHCSKFAEIFPEKRPKNGQEWSILIRIFQCDPEIGPPTSSNFWVLSFDFVCSAINKKDCFKCNLLAVVDKSFCCLRAHHLVLWGVCIKPPGLGSDIPGNLFSGVFKPFWGHLSNIFQWSIFWPKILIFFHSYWKFHI